MFHTPAWLEALRLTYGFQPVVLTTSPPGLDLTNGLVVCFVQSRLTGRRVVSLPFSDYCEPLLDSPEELRCIWGELRDELKDNRWKYIEMRPSELDLSGLPGLRKSETFCLHRLDLRPSLGDLYRRFHRDCVARKIRRAEREGLSYEWGRSEPLLEKFYRLLVLTRRRQLSLPPPLDWFRNLMVCMGDMLKIRLASKSGRPLSSILTLSYKATLVYKYACSDRRFSNLGGTQLLLWKAIQEAKISGSREFNMGGSDWGGPGLIKFKNRWGAEASTSTYWRYGTLATTPSSFGRNTRTVRRVLGRLPLGFLAGVGSLLYKHAA